MRFQDLVTVFGRLEATTKRLEMFEILAELFRQTTPDEIAPIIYMSQGALLPAFHGLELGMSEKLLARALAQAAQRTPEDVLAHFKGTGDLGGREFKPGLGRAYNRCSDLGRIGEVVSKGGREAIANIAAQVGYPIRMALSERVPGPEEIIAKIGRCAVEPKLDGFRCQIHKDGERIEIFSRNLERTTPMFPDLVEAVKRQMRAREIIFEGEAVAFDEGTGELLPFQ